jgi:hypothetical protein
VSPGAENALGWHRLCDWRRHPDVLEMLRG